MHGSTVSSRVRVATSRDSEPTSVHDPYLRLLCAYYLLRRGLTGSMHPEVRRMRELRDAFYRRAWQRAADTAGAQFTQLSDSIADIARGGRRLRVSSNTTSFDDPVTLQLAGDKPAVYRLLGESGIPVPRHVVIDATQEKQVGARRRCRKPRGDGGADRR